MMLKRKHTLFILLVLGVFGMAFMTPLSNKMFEIAKNIEIFSNVYKEINTNYVDDLNPSEMMKIGIDAMMSSLDPYTVYISEAEVENYRLSTEGKYEGIGASIVSMQEDLVVKDLVKDAPSDKAGLKIGDRLLSVNGYSAVGKKGFEAMRFLRGAPGTTVVLEIQRPGETGSRQISITRDEISRPSVPYSGLISDDIAYVSLRSFTQGCAEEVARAFKKLDAQGPLRGFILDLRGNGGGLLNEAVNICNLFLPKGHVVVSTRGKVESRNRTFETRATPFDTTRPLVILIDKNSASASEIVSGTIQDYDRGVLLGQLSFGKGLVQNHMEVGYNSRVKVTTAKYYIPSGRCIQAVEYENGAPVRLPDSLRAVFKTANGRTVLDGGGVSPDVKMEDPEDNELMHFLINKGIIFNYVTDYILKHNIDSLPADYAFDDFDDFSAYFKEHREGYQSSLDKEWQEFSSKLKDQAQASVFKDDLSRITSKVALMEQEQLSLHKDAVVRLIETEVVKRFELDQGRSEYRVKVDPEVLAAAKLIHQPTDYQNILN